MVYSEIRIWKSSKTSSKKCPLTTKSAIDHLPESSLNDAMISEEAKLSCLKNQRTEGKKSKGKLFFQEVFPQ